MAEASGRGLVLAPPFTPVPWAAARPASRAWVVVVLMALLPMLFQSFHYMIDVRPLYLLSKAWPIVMLPFTLYGLFCLRLPYTVRYALLLAYVLGLTPFLSMVYLPNDFLEAMNATNKVWPLTYYFAAAALLHWLRPSSAQIRQAVLALAVLNFAAFIVLWLVVPASAYRSDPTESQVFYLEAERGYRVVLHVGFAFIGLFYTARRFCEQPRLWRLVLLVAALAVLVTIYKQRVAIGTVTVMLLVILSGRLPPKIRWAVIGADIAVALVAVAVQLGGVRASLGASLTIRQQSAGLAFAFIRSQPLRWLFGVGSTTAFSSITLQDILGSPVFYLTDIGWLGVLFEYGLVGAALIALFDLTGWQAAVSASAVGDTWLRAVADYALYLLLVSAVYSVVYIPGEIATITAIAVYGAGLAQASPGRTLANAG